MNFRRTNMFDGQHLLVITSNDKIHYELVFLDNSVEPLFVDAYVPNNYANSFAARIEKLSSQGKWSMIKFNICRAVNKNKINFTHFNFALLNFSPFHFLN